MSVNQNTVKKFKRLFDAEMKAFEKYSAAMDVGFAGYSQTQEEALKHKSYAATNKVMAEFKQYDFTEDQWDELLTQCGYFDCSWEYEVMVGATDSE